MRQHHSDVRPILTHHLDAGFFFIWLMAAGILVFVGPVLLFAAVVILTPPSGDRPKVASSIAYMFLAVDLALLLLVVLPVLGAMTSQPKQDQASSRRNYDLSEPHAYGGVMFPAGSSVSVLPDDTPDYVYLKSPGSVLGMMLVGLVQLGTEHKIHDLAVLTGKLVEASDVNEVPCAPGKLDLRGGETRCMLARDHVFAGHVLAAGTSIAVSGPTEGKPAKLRHGTLVRHELLFDVLWPPGTVVGGISETAEQMAHMLEPFHEEFTFCVPSGGVAVVENAVLHGPIEYSARTVGQSCSISASERGTGGYVEIGADRYRHGQRMEVYSPWQWTGRLDPDPP